MVKHKKSKQLSNKKKNQKGLNNNSHNKKDGPKKIPTIEELLQAGDTAAASMELDQALAFYLSAQDLVQKEHQQQPKLEFSPMAGNGCFGQYTIALVISRGCNSQHAGYH